MSSQQLWLSACGNLTADNKKNIHILISSLRICQYTNFRTNTSWHNGTHVSAPTPGVPFQNIYRGQIKITQNTQKIYFTPRVHDFSQNIEATSNFRAPEAASSLLRAWKRGVTSGPHCYVEFSARCMCTGTNFLLGTLYWYTFSVRYIVVIHIFCSVHCTDTLFCMYRKMCIDYDENIWRHQTKLGRAVGLASGICAPLFYIQ
jgi:hypothetical protein